MSLSDFASAPAPRSSGGKGLPENVVNFVRACAENSVRLPYGGLSVLCLPNPEGNLNRGRHGANRAKALPVELQPVICRADGTYDEKAVATFREADADFDLESWTGQDVIPQSKAAEAFEAFNAQE